MRISDWSSDVCSSDLTCSGRPAGESRCTVSGTRPSAMRGVSARTNNSCSFTARDRKSVVQGKSVSVRVDLGGRSTIKKKQQYHYIANPLSTITIPKTQNKIFILHKKMRQHRQN